jgi:hypothetical protein
VGRKVVSLKRSLGEKWRWKPVRWARLGGTFAALLGVLVPLLLASHSSAQTLTWSEPVNVSNTSGSSWFPDLAVDSTGRVHVVWTENSVDERQRLATDSLLYTVWDGESWSAPNDLYTSVQQSASAYTLRPSIVADQTDTLHLLYRYPATIHHMRASSEFAWSAQAWSAPQRISGSGESAWTDLAVDSRGVLHAIWSEIVAYVVPGGVSVLSTGDTVLGKADDAWTTYTPSDGLAGGDVLDIAIDASGVKWFATDGGLSALSADASRWMTYTMADGLVSGQVQKMLIDGTGDKWLATPNGVSVLSDGNTPFDKSDDVWVTYTAADGLAGDNVLDMAMDISGQMWFATDKGVSVFSVADGKWMTFTEADGLASDSVRVVLVDQAGHKWFGTRRGGNVLNDGGTPFDKADDMWMTYAREAQEESLGSSNILAIVIDDRGRIWFGTTSGLSRLDDGGTPLTGSDDVWMTYSTRDGLLSNQVTAITMDSGGNMWVGTSAGVSVCSPDDECRVSYSVEDGLAQSLITAIEVDQNGDVWLGTQGSEEELLSSDLFYRHSVDWGHTWSSPQNLSRSRSGIGRSLHLHVDAHDVLHVVWDEAQSCGYISSSDGGETWSQRVTFYSDTGSPHQIVAAVDGEGKVLVVWRMASERVMMDEQSPIYYQQSSDGGLTWSVPAQIPNLLARALNDTPFDAYDMAVDSAGYVHLVVVGRAGTVRTPLSVLHTEWDGNAWSAPTTIFETLDFPECPAITISRGNQLHVVWFVRYRDDLFSGGGEYQVWYTQGQSAAPLVSPPPSPTPSPTPTSTPTPVPLPSPTPYPTVAPGSSGLPTGLDTEADEILQLAIALLPLVLVVLPIMAVRLGWFSKLFRR